MYRITSYNVCYTKLLRNRICYPLLAFLGLEKRKPYQSRHTTATLWLAAGESPEWIARQLGHVSTNMLFRVYSRYVPNIAGRDGSAFESIRITSYNVCYTKLLRRWMRKNMEKR